VSFSIGLDIGGTKIAAAIFDQNGTEIDHKIQPTPTAYDAFLDASAAIVEVFDRRGDSAATVGIGVPGAIDHERGTIFAPNIPCIQGKPFRADIEARLKRRVAIGNDASCAALSEAVDGAGAGHRMVFGVIMGTGVGGGFVVDGRIIEGPNGLTGEWGHLPLPFREDSDGPAVACGCGQTGCIEKLVCGAALSRLHETLAGKRADAAQIGEAARSGDGEALRTLDRYYTVVAKAMVTLIHTFDPEIIVVSGGLNNLPGLYEEVPKRWGRYAARKDLKTKFAPAKHGATTGLRGAAWLGKRS
jgi:fructokinase